MVQGAAYLTQEIEGLTGDSRRVAPGFLFAALPGTKADGRLFIGDALAQGATAVLAPPGTELPPATGTVPLIVDDNPRRRFALMAARFYAKQPGTIAAVTGTNGKTSVAHFLRQIWGRSKRKAASIGTLGIQTAEERTAGNLTTPDPVALHRNLRALSDQGVTHLVMEASSHGLDQFRLDGVDVDAAAFTNLSRDHLDYHGSMEVYLESKAYLFSGILKPGGWAVLNAEAPEFEKLQAICKSGHHPIMTYGIGAGDVFCKRVIETPAGYDLDLSVNGERFIASLPLIGRFQIANALCALTLAVALGEPVKRAAAALETLDAAPGRMQRIAGHPTGAMVFVDYAHTPDALAHVLNAVRPHAKGRLAVVFGCGGDRDTGKRPEMGRLACDLADRVIVTDDNPRGEEPAAIRRAILAACSKAEEIGERAEAIATAVASLRKGDVLVVAGKGHETGQIIGDEILPFDDVEAVRAAIGETR
ncbi:MAG: UDP-N-acetylmuramoyl-L-alanyl-D-glutamate--2,6-diaminopimelate ligase [Rhodospirillales bacterium]